jgi:hypothetical protein
VNYFAIPSKEKSQVERRRKKNPRDSIEIEEFVAQKEEEEEKKKLTVVCRPCEGGPNFYLRNPAASVLTPSSS